MTDQARIDELGAVGLISDRPASIIPQNAWSSLQNIRCVDGSISSFAGHDAIATVSSPAETMTSVKNSNGVTFITYAAGSKIYAVSGSTETEIGSGFSSAGTWYSTVLGGVAVFTNGFDNPQYWGGAGSVVNLPYDDTGTETCAWSDVGMTANLLVSFRYHLFALNIEDCDSKNCRKVHWSHPADPGSVPITWDPTKSEYDAGFVELTDTPGCIVDALPLRDTLQIYKSDSIHSVTYTGRYSQNEPIWNFRLVTTTKGLYARDCVCDIGGKHFFVADGDIYLYDGTNFQSIADERVKNLFFDSVSRSNKQKTFVLYYERTQEVWLCYPEEGDTHCTKALVWDSIRNTWSQREIPNCDAGVFALVERSSGYTYDSIPAATYTYDSGPSWATSYDALIDGSPFKDSLILGGVTNLYEMDRTNQAAGTNLTCVAQKTDIDIGDKEDWHMVLQVRPIAVGDAFRVRLGTQPNVGATVTWSDYAIFDPATDYKIDFRATDRLHAIEFSSAADVEWQVSSVEFTYTFVGRR